MFCDIKLGCSREERKHVGKSSVDEAEVEEELVIPFNWIRLEDKLVL